MEKPDFPLPVTTGNLEAMSISVQLSTLTQCNARCKACISRNTPNTAAEIYKVRECDLRRLETHFRTAAVMRARYCILTDKADPLQERDLYLGRVIDLAKRCGMPKIDIHTTYAVENSKWILGLSKYW